MKRHLIYAFTFLLSAVAFAEDNDFPPDEISFPEEDQPIETVFSPLGYRVKNDVRIFVRGTKRSPCMGTPYGIVERDGNTLKVAVKVRQKVSRDRLCIQMRVPFTADIKIADVPPGSYDIIVNGGTHNVRYANLNIAPAIHDSLYDFLYPAVDYVKVDPKTRMVELHGKNPSKHYKLDKIIHTSNGVNTYAIMAIMDGSVCKPNEKGQIDEAVCRPGEEDPFVYHYQLPHDLYAPEILVHVRTLDGFWKNEVFSPKD